MTEYIFTLVFASAVVTSFYCIADRMGIISYYEIHRKKWMPAVCEFCFFFWMHLIMWTFINQKYDFLKVIIFDPRLDELLFLFFTGLAGAVYSRYLLG